MRKMADNDKPRNLQQLSLSASRERPEPTQVKSPY
jgi:hypothetical protein